MIYRIHSKLTTQPEHRNQAIKDAARLNAVIPEGTEYSKRVQATATVIGELILTNPLGKKPVRMDSSNAPDSATYTVSSWDAKTITLNVTATGKIDFLIYR